MPGSLVLRFVIDLSGVHANNFLVQNVMWVLANNVVVKFEGTTLQETVEYNVYKIIVLSQETWDNMLLEGIQNKELCKIRSCPGDTKTSGVDAENKLNPIYGSKYPISLDHQILSDHSVCYSQALYNDLVFELNLAPASQVVKRADPTKLNCVQADPHSAPVQNDLQQDTSRWGANRLQ